ncbi:MAG: hypothetical protein QF609_05205 [Gammaproteobacteria bacterium]|jgi:hypothetical protein|nr:hypothetical protein [Gammaproteobacteria bacterium]HJP34803.1 hypothetical protein [Gammaproteobacteria bacterium]
MTEYRDIIDDIGNAAATISFDRPKRANACTGRKKKGANAFVGKRTPDFSSWC